MRIEKKKKTHFLWGVFRLKGKALNIALHMAHEKGENGSF